VPRDEDLDYYMPQPIPQLTTRMITRRDIADLISVCARSAFDAEERDVMDLLRSASTLRWVDAYESDRERWRRGHLLRFDLYE
jgi:hypothetical protein